jgi:hypothetical protein
MATWESAPLNKLIREGISRFKAYADHKMSCDAWGPGKAYRRCTCGLEDTVEWAEAWLAHLEPKPQSRGTQQ